MLHTGCREVLFPPEFDQLLTLFSCLDTRVLLFLSEYKCLPVQSQKLNIMTLNHAPNRLCCNLVVSKRNHLTLTGTASQVCKWHKSR